jgi:hypothetical protein
VVRAGRGVVVGCYTPLVFALRRLPAIRNENGMTPRYFTLLMVILLVLLLFAGLLLVQS